MTHRIHPDTAELAGILEESWPALRGQTGPVVAEVQQSGAGGEGGEGEQAEQEAPQPLTREDVEDVFSQRFDDLRQELPNLMGQQAEQGQEQGEEDYGQMADNFLEQWQQNLPDDGEITLDDVQDLVQGVSQQVAQQTLQQALPQALEQALEPVHQRFLQQDADALEQRYPQLSDPEIQEEVVQLAVAQAQRMGDPELARNPVFIEQTYKAWAADQADAVQAAASGQQGGQDVVLEGGGGASPAGGDDGPSPQEQIVNARRGSRLFA